MITVTPAMLRTIAGGAAPLADALVGPINRHAAAFGIDTPLLLAHFLGQIAHETGGFKTLEENLNYSAMRLHEVWPNRFPTIAAAQPYAKNPKALAIKTYGGRLGNAPAPSEDGWTYRGSGAIQLTGKDNFAKYGAMVGLDLVGRPELARQPDTAVKTAAAYFADRALAAAQRDDLAAVTLAINGGSNGITERRAMTGRAKSALKVAPVTAAPAARPVLKRGDSGPAVAAWQRDLVAAGYRLDVDSRFGDETEGETKLFQEFNGLAIDGRVGPATRAAMARVLAKPAPAAPVPQPPVPAAPAAVSPAPTTTPDDDPFGPPTPRGFWAALRALFWR